MISNFWWIFALIVFIIDFINPFVGFFGNIFEIISIFIILCLIIVMSIHRKKLKTTVHIKGLAYFGIIFLWLIGIIIRPSIFSVASGFLTDIRKPIGLISLLPSSIEFQASLILTLLSIIFHTIMCIMLIIKVKKEQ